MRNEQNGSANNGLDPSIRFLKALLDGDPPAEIGSELNLSQTRIRRLPDRMKVAGDLLLRQCQRLRSVGETALEVGGNLWIGGSDCGLRPSHLYPNYQNEAPLQTFLQKRSTSRFCPIDRLPDYLAVGGNLRLYLCDNLLGLPEATILSGGLEVVGCPLFYTLLEDFHIKGDLVLKGLPALWKLPSGLRVDGNLRIDGLPISEIPEDLDVRGNIEINNCLNLKSLPANLKIRKQLTIRYCGIEEIPANYHIPECLQIVSTPIKSLLNEIEIGEDIIIRRCRNFASLGSREKYRGDLQIVNCPALEELPQSIVLEGTLHLEDCPNLKTLPASLVARSDTRFWGTRIALLNCPKITALPKHLIVDGAIDIGGASIESATPAQYKGNQFAWRGFSIEGTALFDPGSLDPKRVIQERNAEVRRLLIGRYGIDRLLHDLKHKIVDEDFDPGGMRRLILFKRAGRLNRDLCFLDCCCPSTGCPYLLEVPPETRSCHEAAAWMAGIVDPAKYKPVLET